MKLKFTKYAVWFILGVFQVTSQAAPLDSLINDRNNLKNEYDEIISQPGRTDNNFVNHVFDLQNRIIAKDDAIFENHIQRLLLEKEEAQDQYSVLRIRNNQVEQRVDKLSFTIWILTAALIAGALIIIVLVIIMLVKSKKYKNALNQKQDTQTIIDAYKKKNNELQAEVGLLKKDYQKENNEYDELRKKTIEYEKKAGESHIKIIQLKSDNQKLQEEINQLKSYSLNEQPDDYKSNNISESEVIILEHQLHESRATMEELTETNKHLGLELEKLVHTEKSKEEEIKKLQNEISDLNTKLAETREEIQIFKQSPDNFPAHQNDNKQEPDEQILRLESIIEVYKDRLQKESKAREKLETEVNEILKKYQDYIDSL